MAKEVKESVRYLGKIKKATGKHGDFFKILIDNPSPVDKNNQPDPYFKGILVWIDQKTGQKYIVKQMKVGGVSQSAAANGFVYSIQIDLEDEFHVSKA